jgi:hypothetical protein
MGQESEDEGDDEGILSLLWEERIAIIFSFWFLLIIIGASAILFPSGDDGRSGRHVVTCKEYDGKMATGEKLKEEWVLSDNITSYADIPKSKKENLSNKSITILKRANSSFKPTHYDNLSNAEQRLFKQALNTTVWTDISLAGDVVYRGNLYACDTDAAPNRGA